MKLTALALVLIPFSLSFGMSPNCARFQKTAHRSDFLVPEALIEYRSVETSPQKLAAIEAKVRTLLSSTEFKNYYCKRLSAYITDAEMGKIADFYSTPAGEKWLRVFPAFKQNLVFILKDYLSAKSGEFTSKGLPAFPY